MLDFPNSPTASQQFTAAGVTWTWDGAKWLPGGLSPLVVPGINDNRIINGDMRIDQRNNGASGTANGYSRLIDGIYSGTQTGKVTGSGGRAAGSRTVGFPILCRASYRHRPTQPLAAVMTSFQPEH